MKPCEHPADKVVADILEGDVHDKSVQWCRLCGAYRRLFLTQTDAPQYSVWRFPESAMPKESQINEGLWFRAATTGLWHEDIKAAGTVDAIRYNGQQYEFHTELVKI